MKTVEIIPRLTDVCKYLELLIENANENFDNSDKRFGGYLTIIDKENGRLIVTMLIGQVPAEKEEKYLQLSVEKARRLFDYPNHNTSWESKNEKESQYPGAIRGEEGIYSFSGCSADVDEALSIAAFYLIEPVGIEAERYKSGIEKFRYYYEQVSGRNYFVRSFMSILRMSYNNAWSGISFLQGSSKSYKV